MVSQDRKAIVVVDVQNDFCPGGALAVPRGDEVVPAINALVEQFASSGDPAVYTQDWHPADHCSFKHQGGQWPPHCVQGTRGAEFHPGLKVVGSVFKKGFVPDREAYSGFDAREGGVRGGETLHEWLQRSGVSAIFVTGLATDYCVLATVLDGLKLGYRVTVVSRAVRAVNVKPGDGEAAIRKMTEAGAAVI